MSLSLNKPKLDNLANEIWKSAERLRGKFKAYEYQSICSADHRHPAKSHKKRVMLIDARKQFEKEPKSFCNKRNRITDAHRVWIEECYRDGWADGYADEDVKLFKTNDFAFHKVSVVFWQSDENDKPAIVTEPYEKAFTAANITKEQAFYDSELKFSVTVSPHPPFGHLLPEVEGLVSKGEVLESEGEGIKLRSPCGRRVVGERETATVTIVLKPDDSFTKVFEAAVKKALPHPVLCATLTQRARGELLPMPKHSRSS